MNLTKRLKSIFSTHPIFNETAANSNKVLKGLKIEPKTKQIKFKEIKAGDLTISYDGDELVVGTKVFLYNKRSGLNELIKDGEYILNDNRVILVDGGIVKSIGIKEAKFRASKLNKTDIEKLEDLSRRLDMLNKKI